MLHAKIVTYVDCTRQTDNMTIFNNKLTILENAYSRIRTRYICDKAKRGECTWTFIYIYRKIYVYICTIYTYHYELIPFSKPIERDRKKLRKENEIPSMAVDST